MPGLQKAQIPQWNLHVQRFKALLRVHSGEVEGQEHPVNKIQVQDKDNEVHKFQRNSNKHRKNLREWKLRNSKLQQLTILKVFEGECRGEKVAVKIFNKLQILDKKQDELVIEETRLHCKLKHPHIIKLKYIAENETSLFIVLELAHNGTLARIVDLV